MGNCDGEDAENLDEDIETEDDELQIKCNRAQMTEDPNQMSVTGLEIRAIIAVETEKSSSCSNSLFLGELVENRLIDALQVGNNSQQNSEDSFI